MNVGILSFRKTGRLYPPSKYLWYLFLLESESTPRPQCGMKNYVNKNFQGYRRELKPLSSGLWCSAVLQLSSLRRD
jgi:hypothetical protein